MNSGAGKFFAVWMVISIIAGCVTGYLAFQSNHNWDAAGFEGLRWFLLTYLAGWVIFRVARYVEQVRPGSGENDRSGEDE